MCQILIYKGNNLRNCGGGCVVPLPKLSICMFFFCKTANYSWRWTQQYVKASPKNFVTFEQKVCFPRLNCPLATIPSSFGYVFARVVRLFVGFCSNYIFLKTQASYTNICNCTPLKRAHSPQRNYYYNNQRRNCSRGTLWLLFLGTLIQGAGS